MVMMAPPKRFELIYPPIIKQHLKSIEAKYYSLIQESLETQVQFQPDVETRNRKPLRYPVIFGAKWETRLGQMIVFGYFTEWIMTINKSFYWQ
jgi:hypothetical protein